MSRTGIAPAKRGTTLAGAAPQPVLPDFRAFAQDVLDWRFSPKAYAGTPEAPMPTELEVHLPDTGETLRPQFAVRKAAAGRPANPQAPSRNATPANKRNGESPWQLLVSTAPTATFDAVVRTKGGTDASAHGRMERLLRGTGAPAGLLFNGTSLRLISAPRGESSGWLDFRVADMVQTAGRPIAAAMRLLLNERRLLAVPPQQRLAGLLAESRKFQNEVSERLAEQVLYELLRGFQAAHDTPRANCLPGRCATTRTTSTAACSPSAPATVDLEALLQQEPGRRAKWLQEGTDRKLTDKTRKAVAQAETLEDAHAALDSTIDKDATPDWAAAGAIVLQPSEERRRPGSHYTPANSPNPSFAPPLDPILNRLREEHGGAPLPAQILDLKVCDPAMGSGAFLVEACRQLADVLVDA